MYFKTYNSLYDLNPEKVIYILTGRSFFDVAGI